MKLLCIWLIFFSFCLCQGQTRFYLTPLLLGVGFEKNRQAYRNPIVFATGMGCEFPNRMILEAGANFAIFSDETYRDQAFGGGWFGGTEYAMQRVAAVYLMAGRGFTLGKKWELYASGGGGIVSYKYPTGIGGSSGGWLTRPRSWVLYNSDLSACLPVHTCLQYKITTRFRGQMGVQYYFNRSFGYGMAYLTLALRLGEDEQAELDAKSRH